MDRAGSAGDFLRACPHRTDCSPINSAGVRHRSRPGASASSPFAVPKQATELLGYNRIDREGDATHTWEIREQQARRQRAVRGEHHILKMRGNTAKRHQLSRRRYVVPPHILVCVGAQACLKCFPIHRASFKVEDACQEGVQDNGETRHCATGSKNGMFFGAEMS